MTRATAINFADFARLELRLGTVTAAVPHERARHPAYVLTLDFGPLGTRTSSAQLTENYTPEALVGRQMVAVMNLPPKRVAGVKSEVLVLAAVSEDAGTVLLAPERLVENGTRVA